ncbi:hypothetical protein A1351_14570 [Methylosinus sp. R-45379]|uniref:hypothetical protein n=1 Tax=unclassified Methylosinus TaxID=2624500 RepID=UPI0004659EC1|nr:MULTISPECIES: hypothetical protein [unclassified Methylosinus]OAI26536.1 hypothetical protein A1351_14570 [Methylosinus sp. R-45379]
MFKRVIFTLGLFAFSGSAMAAVCTSCGYNTISTNGVSLNAVAATGGKTAGANGWRILSVELPAGASTAK